MSLGGWTLGASARGATKLAESSWELLTSLQRYELAQAAILCRVGLGVPLASVSSIAATSLGLVVPMGERRADLSPWGVFVLYTYALKDPYVLATAGKGGAS